MFSCRKQNYFFGATRPEIGTVARQPQFPGNPASASVVETAKGANGPYPFGAAWLRRQIKEFQLGRAIHGCQSVDCSDRRLARDSSIALRKPGGI